MPPMESHEVQTTSPKSKLPRWAVAVIIVAIAATLVFIVGKKEQVIPGITQEPARTEFGSKPPTDFPTNVPVEEGAKVDQSYSLDYKGEKQLTIVFPSAKTVKQNYALYADFLKSDGWVVTNTYESETVASSYGTKDENEINITISAGGAGISLSQVSISFLQK